MNFQTIILQLGQGMLVTVEIFFLTLLFSLPLGLLVAFGRMSKNVLLKGISKIYISIMRGTPLMLQLIVVYFGPYYLFGTNLKGYRFPAIIIAFAVMQHTLPRFTVAELNPCRWDSMRPQRFWAMGRCRPSSRSFSRR